MDTKPQFLILPLWWYTTGLGLAANWVRRHWHYAVSRSGIVLFARHLREPLYGDYSRSGRVISFFLRLVLLGGKLIWLAIWGSFLALVILIYVLMLPLAVVMVVYQAFGLID